MAKKKSEVSTAGEGKRSVIKTHDDLQSFEDTVLPKLKAGKPLSKNEVKLIEQLIQELSKLWFEHNSKEIESVLLDRGLSFFRR
jgi:hypothetical protein